MAHIWSIIKERSEGRWGAHALAGDGCAVAVDGDGPRFHAPASAPGVGALVFLILPAEQVGARPAWTLLASAGVRVRVNGRAVPLDIRVLADKDEIRAGGHRLFFSTEELARVAPFPSLVQPAFCPRCKQKIEPGDPAVCCPSCHAWSHQSEKFPCWTYDTTCALCQQQSSALDAGFNFNPAIL